MNNGGYTERQSDFSFADRLLLGIGAGAIIVSDKIKSFYSSLTPSGYKAEVERIYEERMAIQMREKREEKALNERIFTQVKQIDSTTGLQRYPI